MELADCYYTGKDAEAIRRLNNRLRAREGKAPLPYKCFADGEVITSEYHEERHRDSATHQLAVERRSERLLTKLARKRP